MIRGNYVTFCIRNTEGCSLDIQIVRQNGQVGLDYSWYLSKATKGPVLLIKQNQSRNTGKISVVSKRWP